MKREIPVCKRCCFCVPLRYGLLVWGYVRMTADAFLITMISCSLVQIVMMIRLNHPNYNYQSQMFEELILPVIALAVFVADFAVTILFIVGGHKKNVKLIRVFYSISIAMLIFTLILAVTAVFLTIQELIFRRLYPEMSVLIFSFYFVVLVIQGYFLILLRSEIIKLNDNGDFRFVNNAAEAECTMKCQEVTAERNTEREDV